MLGHDNVADDHETVAQPSLFQHRKEAVTTPCQAKKSKAPVAGTRDKVQMMRAIVAMQSARHNQLNVSAASQPTLAKSARVGHPRFRYGKGKTSRPRKAGPPALCAVLIDGTPFRDRQMIVALGINVDGRKTVLGLREGATENAAVVSELLGDLASRGLDFSVPRLYVLDGGKALAAAVRRHAGEAAMIQRCQVHKRRNVIDHLPEEHKSAVRKKLQNAYAMTEYADARRALDRLHRELMELNPSAARSLEEGMEETLTVHRLRMPAQLRRTLASTNVIESAFSIVETVCRNVKRWRAGDHIERWVGSGLLVAERQFRKVQGYREIPALLTALANTVSKKGLAEDMKVA